MVSGQWPVMAGKCRIAPLTGHHSQFTTHHSPPHPPAFLVLNPSATSSVKTLSLKSPCINISPSFTEPPTPHFDFNFLPIRSSSPLGPIKPLIRVTTFPPPL